MISGGMSDLTREQVEAWWERITMSLPSHLQGAPTDASGYSDECPLCAANKMQAALLATMDALATAEARNEAALAVLDKHVRTFTLSAGSPSRKAAAILRGDEPAPSPADPKEDADAE
jgi:hypothetical protein